ncbi:hypothetical protein NRF20_06190 [Streptomyces sp. R-74717]
MGVDAYPGGERRGLAEPAKGFGESRFRLVRRAGQSGVEDGL